MMTTPANIQTAMSYYEAGQFQAASQAFAEVLQTDVENAEAWHRLGTLMLMAGEVDAALDCITKGIQFGGPTAERFYHLGLVHRARNEPEQTEAAFRQSLQLDANDVRTLSALASMLFQRDRFDETADLLRHVLQVDSTNATVRCQLAAVLKKQGHVAEALAEYRAVLKQDPENVQAYSDLGLHFVETGQYDEAIAMCRRAMALNPNHGQARAHLALALRHQSLESIPRLRAALEQDASDAVAWASLGDALLHTGEPGPAADAFGKAVEFEPTNHTAGSYQIYCSQFVPGITAKRMSELYTNWDRRHVQPLASKRPRLRNDPDPERRLRLGILSPHLRHHPPALMTVLGFENLDRSQFETFFYSDNRAEDHFTARFRKVADHWQLAAGMSDAEVSDTVFNDQIDVLLVMGGHQANNRQLVAARKPAPVQIGWTGDPSGHTGIDWLLTDRFVVPEEFEEFYPESILRMPNDYATFDPPEFTLEIDSNPSDSNGFVTFGSFNQAVKLHPALLELWAGIMQRVPDSRLLMIGKSQIDSAERTLAPFIKAGIARERIELSDSVARSKLLESYNRVDVSLDTFPFSGGVTSFEALWMGVPVVTLPCETFASRTAFSHVSNVGLADLVAANEAEYADIAVEIAMDTERRSRLRAELGGQMKASPVCDGPQFGRDLSTTLRAAWKVWVEKQSTSD